MYPRLKGIEDNTCFLLCVRRPPAKEDSPNRPEEQATSSVETPRATEIDESRRKKLREVELKVAEYAQKLEAKGASNIAQQCDVYRAKLLEVRTISFWQLPLVRHKHIYETNNVAVH